MNSGNLPLEAKHLNRLAAALHLGAAQASDSLAKWIGKPSLIEVDSLEQLPLADATGILSDTDDPICCCSVELSGQLTGEMLLAFSDDGGFSLCDSILDQPPGTTVEWDDVATSAALETANIVCCAYLNALADTLSGGEDGFELLPSPPRFGRDFPESLIQFALIGQAMTYDQVIVAKTRFEIAGRPADWTLLFVPDSEALARLPQLLERLAVEP